MEDDINALLLTSEDLLYWWPWTPFQYFQFPVPIQSHPIFGAHPSTIYYLPVIAERDELEPELSSNGAAAERILIEELYGECGEEDDAVESEQAEHYTVEEPPEKEEERNKPSSESAIETKRSDICDVELESERHDGKLDSEK
ncbi:hypothetical protein RP20_CCG009570 [Aedes albopictus]|nr:hypothetical protein RP20_CCG009570 [Aedes albopictus]